MGFNVWRIPTEEGKQSFGWVPKKMNEKTYLSKDDAEEDAYLSFLDDPAPDKGEYYSYKVLPEGEEP